MGILDQLPILFHAEGGDSFSNVDETGLPASRIAEFAEKPLHPLAGIENKVGIGDIADVTGRGFEFMGIDARSDDGLDRHMAAAYVFCEVRRDG